LANRYKRSKSFRFIGGDMVFAIDSSAIIFEKGPPWPFVYQNGIGSIILYAKSHSF